MLQASTGKFCVARSRQRTPDVLFPTGTLLPSTLPSRDPALLSTHDRQPDHRGQASDHRPPAPRTTTSHASAPPQNRTAPAVADASSPPAIDPINHPIVPQPPSRKQFPRVKRPTQHSSRCPARSPRQVHATWGRPRPCAILCPRAAPRPSPVNSPAANGPSPARRTRRSCITQDLQARFKGAPGTPRG